MCLKIREQSFDAFSVNFFDKATFTEASFPFGGFFCQNMTRVGFFPFYLSALGFTKSFGRTSISFYFRHKLPFLNP